jgi:hypothetical protein
VSNYGPDLASISALARLRARFRCLRFRGASRELRDLIAFCGLEEALRVEPRRQPEKGEERLRVEEEGELGNPVG